MDSNHRPTGYEPAALTAELPARFGFLKPSGALAALSSLRVVTARDLTTHLSALGEHLDDLGSSSLSPADPLLT
jgi:hypothetical protein